MEGDETEIIKEVHLLCQLGEAWYEKEGKFFIFSLDREKPEHCRAGDIQLLYDISSEEIKKENITLATIRSELEACYRANTAFSFLLDGLDRSLEEVRQQVIKRATELCQDEAVQCFVHDKLLSHTIPKEADIEGAIEIASNLGKEGQQALAIYQLILPNTTIFIDSAEDDIKIATNIEEYLPEIQNSKITTIEYHDDTNKNFEELEKKLNSSDKTIIVYSKAPLSWLTERIRYYQKTLVKLKKNMDILIYSSMPKPDNIKLPINMVWQQETRLTSI